MLSFEELAVLLALEPDVGLQKSTVAYHAQGLYDGDKFDRHVALSIIDNLVGRDLISRDRSGFHYITPDGDAAIKETKEGTKFIFGKLLNIA